jgi:hypothetical protein
MGKIGIFALTHPAVCAMMVGCRDRRFPAEVDPSDQGSHPAARLGASLEVEGASFAPEFIPGFACRPSIRTVSTVSRRRP